MQRFLYLLVLATGSVGLGACDLVGDVIEFGFWVALVLIVVVTVVVWLFIRAVRRER
ncbi:MAG: hypothetical protein ACOCVZ_02490 [Gemmatimonadota bacterium]